MHRTGACGLLVHLIQEYLAVLIEQKQLGIAEYLLHKADFIVGKFLIIVVVIKTATFS
jgi:hypothetical protein